MTLRLNDGGPDIRLNKVYEALYFAKKTWGKDDTNYIHQALRGKSYEVVRLYVELYERARAGNSVSKRSFIKSLSKIFTKK